MVVLVALAVLDRREPDAPPLAPPRLLGEEAGEELDEVAIAGAGQHAEAFEQLELHAVASCRSPLVHSAPSRELLEPESVGQIASAAARRAAVVGVVEELRAASGEAVVAGDVAAR